jgi:hypothetical protein
MEVAKFSSLDTWKAVSLPRVIDSEWDPETALAALSELKRLRGEFEAAVAVLVGIVSVRARRDTRATVVRELGVSQGEASKILRTAKVVSALHGVAEGIAAGEYSADHVQRVAKVPESEDAAELLAVASTMSPDDFGKRVDKFLIDNVGCKRKARQQAERSVKFFETENGSVGMRAVLPETAGKLLRKNLDAIMNDQYREKYPERANVAGEREIDSLGQRLADALIEAVNGDGRSDLAEDSTDSEDAANESLLRLLPDEGARISKLKRKKNQKKYRARGRTAVIVTISLEHLEAQILGSGSIECDDAFDLIGQARTDVYFYVHEATGAPLKFGRSRRLATEMQKLAMAVRENGVCSWCSCATTWDQCEADHVPAFYPENPGDPLGQTDVDKMNLKCQCHHKHRHETGEDSAIGAVRYRKLAKPDKPQRSAAA